MIAGVALDYIASGSFDSLEQQKGEERATEGFLQ